MVNNKGIAKRTETSVAKVAPKFLANYVAKDHSTDLMDEYRILPRLKIIQGLTKPELKAEFGEGAVVIVPGAQLVCPNDGSFDFVPLFFFPEYIKWADRRDSSQNAIVEKTLDKSSELANICRDPERRTEPYGQQNKKGEQPWEYRYVEHLCFVGLIRGTNDPVVLSFQRGDFGVGRSLISMIKMRRIDGEQAPIWSQVYRLSPNQRNRNGNQWWGLDPSQADEPWINEEEADMFLALHDGLRKDYDKKTLGVDRSDGAEEVVEVDPEAEPEM